MSQRLKERARCKLSKLPLFALACSPLLLNATVLWARGGGGHSFSGGGHSGGGSFSHGSGYSGGSHSSSSPRDDYFLFEAVVRLIYFLCRLAIERPLIGIPVDLAICYLIYKLFEAWNHVGYDISGDGVDPADVERRRVSRAALDRIRQQQDPNFSEIALNDFLHSLYSTIHHARGTSGRLHAYSGYLSPEAINTLDFLTPGLKSVQGVVIGAAGLVEVSTIDPDSADSKAAPLRIAVAFESCYVELSEGKLPQGVYSRETWRLSRKAGVMSREPKAIRQIACPACGAPANADEQGRCPACGNVVRSGQFDWYVDSIDCARQSRPDLTTSTVQERGTDLPTLLDPNFAAESKALQQRDPAFTWPAFNERAALIFAQVQKAWTERKWDQVRPFETDNIFDSHSYWISEYRQQKLINVLKDIRLSQMIPCGVHQDKFYTSITLRMCASMVDYTTRENGEVVSGNPKRPRAFTEYWTFIRGKSAQPSRPGSGSLNCPACGAPLKINMAGVCEYCQAKIVSGDFDWVLSLIEQDETYIG